MLLESLGLPSDTLYFIVSKDGSNDYVFKLICPLPSCSKFIIHTQLAPEFRKIGL